MSGREELQEGEERVEELLRVNAELAAEVRRLALPRAEEPRGSAMPTGRRLAVLKDEREALAGALEETRTGLTEMTASRDELARQNQELLREIAKLRSGYAGILRRLRARLRTLVRR